MSFAIHNNYTWLLRILIASMTMHPAMTALVVAMAGIMFPAIDFTSNLNILFDKKYLIKKEHYINARSYNIYFWLRFGLSIFFVYKKSLKRKLKTGFWVQNHLMNLCSSAVNSQRLLCILKAGVKCSNLSFS